MNKWAGKIVHSLPFYVKNCIKLKIILVFILPYQKFFVTLHQRIKNNSNFINNLKQFHYGTHD